MRDSTRLELRDQRRPVARFGCRHAVAAGQIRHESWLARGQDRIRRDSFPYRLEHHQEVGVPPPVADQLLRLPAALAFLPMAHLHGREHPDEPAGRLDQGIAKPIADHGEESDEVRHPEEHGDLAALQQRNPGMVATANHCVSAIPYVCAAEPGIRTYLDLPLVAGRAALRR